MMRRGWYKGSANLLRNGVIGSIMEIMAADCQQRNEREASRVDIWIKLARERLSELGMSQAQLGEKLGVSSGAINHYLGGRRDPTADLLIRMADVLECDVGWLLTGKKAPPCSINTKDLATAIETIESMVRKNAWDIDVTLRAELIAEVYAIQKEDDEKARYARMANVITMATRICGTPSEQ